jgi:hypothetical protein
MMTDHRQLIVIIGAQKQTLPALQRHAASTTIAIPCPTPMQSVATP